MGGRLRGQLRQPRSDARERRNVANMSSFAQWLDPAEPIYTNPAGILTIRTGDGIAVSSGDLVVETQGVVGADANGVLLNYGNGLTASSGNLIVDLGDGLTFVGGAVEPDLAAAGGLEIVGGQLAVDESNVDHDSLANFVANEHVDHSGVTVTGGVGISGGGDLTTSRTLDLDLSGLSEATTVDRNNDRLVLYDASTGSHKYIHPPNPNLGAREQLNADRTYYVDGTNGSDSNDGLTTGTAFATIQKGVDVAATLDLSIYDVIIQIANGTYNEVVVLKTLSGAGKCILRGDPASPNNVTISSAGPISTSGYQGLYLLDGLTIQSSGRGINIAGFGAKLDFQNIIFGTASGSAHIRASLGAQVSAVGDYEINGGADRHLFISDAGIAYWNGGYTLTLTGTPVFGVAFAQIARASYFLWRAGSITVQNSAGGKRYEITENSTAVVGSTTALPGDSAGTTSTGGVYV